MSRCHSHCTREIETVLIFPTNITIYPKQDYFLRKHFKNTAVRREKTLLQKEKESNRFPSSTPNSHSLTKVAHMNNQQETPLKVSLQDKCATQYHSLAGSPSPGNVFPCCLSMNSFASPIVFLSLCLPRQPHLAAAAAAEGFVVSINTYQKHLFSRIYTEGINYSPQSRISDSLLTNRCSFPRYPSSITSKQILARSPLD